MTVLACLFVIYLFNLLLFLAEKILSLSLALALSFNLFARSRQIDGPLVFFQVESKQVSQSANERASDDVLKYN